MLPALQGYKRACLLQGPAETGSKEADTTMNARGQEPMDNVAPFSEDNPVQSGKPNKPEAKEQLLPQLVVKSSINGYRFS